LPPESVESSHSEGTSSEEPDLYEAGQQSQGDGPSYSDGVLKGTLYIHDKVRKAYGDDPWFQDEQHTAAYAYRDGLWWAARNQLNVPNKQTFRQAIIAEMHDNPMYGHMGITKKKKKGKNVVACTPATQRSCLGLPSADDK